MGINIRRLYMITFGIGAACARGFGCSHRSFHPCLSLCGVAFCDYGFCGGCAGRMGNILGAFVGGLIIGVADSVGAMFLPGAMKSIISFTIFIIILLFSPRVSSREKMAEPRGHLKRKLVFPRGLPVVCVLAALHALPWVFPSILHIMIMIFSLLPDGPGVERARRLRRPVLFGHSLFFGVGAYVSSLLFVRSV